MASSFAVILAAIVARVGRASAPISTPPGAEPSIAAATGFSPFRGYTGQLRVRGSLYLVQDEPLQMALGYALFGLDPSCGFDTFLAPRNGCMVQIHRGKSCTEIDTDLSQQTAYGQQYLAADGWAMSIDGVVNLTTMGSLHAASFVGHTVVVVTDRQGAPFACSPLEPFFERSDPELGVMAWQRHPGYAGELEVQGRAEIKQVTRARDGGTGQVLVLMLEGLDSACVAAASTSGDTCGIHVHEGASCASAKLGDHFWDQALVPEDPWQSVRYHPHIPVLMTAPVVTGLAGEGLLNRTLVAHDVAGAPIACAEIRGLASTKDAEAARATNSQPTILASAATLLGRAGRA